MTDLGCRVVNWNIAWRGVRSKPGNEIRDRIHAEAADVICLTETHEGFLGDPANTICSHANYGYPLRAGRRKALLWSRNPWTDIDEIGSPDLPGGRFIKGRTRTPIGAINSVGVCIPWAAAHVSSGRRDRRRWADHTAYIAGLKQVLRRFPRDTVVIGDFNQKIPRTRAPKLVY